MAATHSLELDGKRQLVIGTLDTSPSESIQRPFVTLFPAFSAPERQQAEALTSFLIRLGCIEFCSVGPEAELLHDTLDDLIEAGRAFEVVTTWHEDVMDACEYFLHAAAGGRANLLALVSSHPELQAMLEQDVRRRCG